MGAPVGVEQTEQVQRNKRVGGLDSKLRPET